jgi:hypothetical protein
MNRVPRFTVMQHRRWVQPVERVYRVWVMPVRGVGGMDAVVKPTWRYLRRPLTGTARPITVMSGRRVTPHHRFPLIIKNGLICLRNCFKNPQLAQYGVKNRLKMLIYSIKLRFLADFCLVLHTPE